MTIKVLVNGAQGKMGQEAVIAIGNSPELTLVGQIGKKDDLAEKIATIKPDVVVDLTTASAAFVNARTIIAAGVHPVIGTSGLLPPQIAELQQICAEKKLGGLIAPNFSIGALLMMKYAEDCARYFPDVEIIELHHHQKLDAPSATALRTAEAIARERKKEAQSLSPKEAVETFAGARGASYQGIPIHSIRLPGILADQEVVFGGPGQTVTIQHRVLNRAAYMPGICLACQKVPQLQTLIYGLEHIL